MKAEIEKSFLCTIDYDEDVLYHGGHKEKHDSHADKKDVKNKGFLGFFMGNNNKKKEEEKNQQKWH